MWPTFPFGGPVTQPRFHAAGSGHSDSPGGSEPSVLEAGIAAPGQRWSPKSGICTPRSKPGECSSGGRGPGAHSWGGLSPTLRPLCGGSRSAVCGHVLHAARCVRIPHRRTAGSRCQGQCLGWLPRAVRLRRGPCQHSADGPGALFPGVQAASSSFRLKLHGIFLLP